MKVFRVVTGEVAKTGVVVHPDEAVQLGSEAASVNALVQRGVAGWPCGVELLQAHLGQGFPRLKLAVYHTLPSYLLSCLSRILNIKC